MYRGRGVVGSKQEIGHIDRKRINEALDKHLEKSSTPISKGLNAKDKERLSVPSTSSGKLPPDHRDTCSISLSKNKCSDEMGSRSWRKSKTQIGRVGNLKNSQERCGIARGLLKNLNGK